MKLSSWLWMKRLVERERWWWLRSLARMRAVVRYWPWLRAALSIAKPEPRLPSLLLLRLERNEDLWPWKPSKPLRCPPDHHRTGLKSNEWLTRQRPCIASPETPILFTLILSLLKLPGSLGPSCMACVPWEWLLITWQSVSLIKGSEPSGFASSSTSSRVMRLKRKCGEYLPPELFSRS